MNTTTMPREARRAPRRGGGLPSTSDVVRSEWLKLRSLPSTRWAALATVAVSLGVSSTVTFVLTRQWSTQSEADRKQVMHDPIGLILQPGQQWSQMAVCVLAVLAITGEFGTGAIRSTLLAVPTRTPMLVGKAAVIAAFSFVLGELIAIGSLLLNVPVVARHAHLAIGDPDVIRAILGTGAFLAVTALLALGVGALIRNTAAAITATIALVAVVPSAASALPGRLGEYVVTYVPGGEAGQMIMTSGHSQGSVIGPWAGLLVAFGWAALVLALAAVSLRRRDV